MIKEIQNENFEYINEIYTRKFEFKKQDVEFKMRKEIAQMFFDNYLDEISKFHSIEVMDREVKKFVNQLKEDSIILDLGCGWCWHWRDLEKYRPDIRIVALDFVHENFFHAKKILSAETKKQIYFVNDDMHKLNFKDNTFDAIWTVQVFQHIQQISQVLRESVRVLKKNCWIYNYHLNNSIFVKLKDLFSKKKNIKNYYYLNRNIGLIEKIFFNIFRNKIIKEYNEIIFHPELNLYLGKKNSFLSTLDSKMSNSNFLGSLFSRQVLIKTKK